MAAMLVMLGSISVFAATEPTVTSDAICYISYQTGNNDYDGQSMDTAKKQFLTVEDNGCISVLADGGTLIVCGKAFIGGDYIMPELGSTLKITSSDGKVNYKNSMPFENPACAMKMRSGATLTLQQDTIIDDIILFRTLEIADVERIIELELQGLLNRTKKLGYKVKITEGAKRRLATMGYESRYGVRSLKRTLMDNVEEPLSSLIIDGKLHEGDTVVVESDKAHGVKLRVA